MRFSTRYVARRVYTQLVRELRRGDRRKLILRSLPRALLLAAVPKGALGFGRVQVGLQRNRAGMPRLEL